MRGTALTVVLALVGLSMLITVHLFYFIFYLTIFLNERHRSYRCTRSCQSINADHGTQLYILVLFDHCCVYPHLSTPWNWVLLNERDCLLLL